jgi:hypothetical protein
MAMLNNQMVSASLSIFSSHPIPFVGCLKTSCHVQVDPGCRAMMHFLLINLPMAMPSQAVDPKTS